MINRCNVYYRCFTQKLKGALQSVFVEVAGGKIQEKGKGSIVKGSKKGRQGKQEGKEKGERRSGKKKWKEKVERKSGKKREGEMKGKDE